jgi:hypothetical protein
MKLAAIWGISMFSIEIEENGSKGTMLSRKCIFAAPQYNK